MIAQNPAFLSLTELYCCCSVAQSCPTLLDPMNRSTPGLPVHHQLPEFTQLTSIESVMPSSHLILCRPLLLPPSIFATIRVFSNESAPVIRWPKYWSSIRSKEYSGLISLRIDCFYFAVCSRDCQNPSPVPQFEAINS